MTSTSDGRPTAHDLPNCPPVKVTKTVTGWSWVHLCPWRGHEVGYGGYATHPLAYTDALAHANHCFQM